MPGKIILTGTTKQFTRDRSGWVVRHVSMAGAIQQGRETLRLGWTKLQPTAVGVKEATAPPVPVPTTVFYFV